MTAMFPRIQRCHCHPATATLSKATTLLNNKKSTDPQKKKKKKKISKNHKNHQKWHISLNNTPNATELAPK
jgi:hypothetical protein